MWFSRLYFISFITKTFCFVVSLQSNDYVRSDVEYRNMDNIIEH